jgi:hypothetical protein
MVTENADSAVTHILSSDPQTVDKNAANMSALLLFLYVVNHGSPIVAL